jgi:hypothetical protein
LTSALWKKLDKTAQARFRDPDYLKTLPNPYIAIQEAAENQAAAAQASLAVADDAQLGIEPLQMGPKKSRKQFVDLKPEQWAKKTVLDVSHSFLVTIIA